VDQADDVVNRLDELMKERGASYYLRTDNGPEFVAHLLDDWCRFNGAGSLFIDPGSPWQNGWIESFNARLRDEFGLRELTFDIDCTARSAWLHRRKSKCPIVSSGERPRRRFP
jgi:transposase InsO family protein